MKKDLREHFEERVFRPETPCWNWRAYRNKKGYPILVKDSHHHYAHRVAYKLFVGPIPEGLEIHHRCYNRACVNPEHLEAVTHTVNIAASRAPNVLNGKKTHCKHGHEFTSENTLVVKGGWRQCLTCKRAIAREAQRQRTGYYDKRGPDGKLTHCRHGHAYEGDNIVIDHRGNRICRTCRNERAKLRERRKRAEASGERRFRAGSSR